MRDILYGGRRYRVNDVGDVFVLTEFTAHRLSSFKRYGRQYERASTTEREWMLADPQTAREVRKLFHEQTQQDKVS